MNQNNEGPETCGITGVQFSIMGPDEIRGRSVVEVTKHETYEKDVPVIKGLFDIRMGTTEMNKICGTCGQNNVLCPGHFGHIELARPIFHYHFIGMIVKILNCVCLQCSSILVDKNSPQIKELMKKCNKLRWNEIVAISKKINRCGQITGCGCGAKQPERIKTDGMDGIFATWKNLDDIEDNEMKTQQLTAEHVKEIFEKITDEDCNVLGFNHLWSRPEWLICSVFPVCPPAVRPSVKQNNSQRMDDDLTHKLCDIVKCNNTLKSKIENNSRIDVINDWTKVLQYHVATFVDNDLPGTAQAVHRSGRSLKAIRSRLKGKEGRIRNNLMGKRVDYSGRSVITPDPNIELDHLGVPFKIAMNLTYPEIVNDFNKEKLNGLLENGIDKYPGIKLIQKINNTKITITKFNKNDIILENGDIVHRHLLDGDWVLFNRQPSLHKMSMMAHRVKVMKGNTFRLNISVTPPYNADFDGDEMNIHAPQSIASVCELMNIASVSQQIISPRENKPIITIVQDTLLGINKLTKGEMIYYQSPSSDTNYYSNNTNIYPLQKTSEKGVSSKVVETTYLNHSQCMNILCNLSTFDGNIPEPTMEIDFQGNKIPMWSGKDIISYIIPNHINLNMENNSYARNSNDELNRVIIKNGKLISGALDKGLFTSTSKGLIHTIFNDLGPQRCKNFIDDLQKIVSYFLLIEGFSMGIGDIIADDETNEKITKVIQENKLKINEIMQEIHLNIFENLSGKSNKEYFEGKVNSLLNDTLKQTGNIGLENIDEKNRATNMINCGSKGKIQNIAQMVACLGQQNVDGKRIPDGFIDRTLPHYSKYDDSSEARGFVDNSFISGQTPQEYFFHAMGGREGLIDTAVKTSETGYLQRKLIKSMEDLRVEYDFSVRNSSGCILQFVYGDDGMDACKVENQSLMIMNMNTDQLCKEFLFDKKVSWKSILTKEAHNLLKKVKDYKKTLEQSFYQLLEHKHYIFHTIFNENQLENRVIYPIHIERIITNMVNETNKISDISPIEILEQNTILKNKLKINSVFNNNKLIHILIDVHLNPKKLIVKHKIQKNEYDRIISTIHQLFEKSRINPGEMVGAIAAQSIGEPATQMTLNTFHLAGVSSKSNVTRGIPRLRELIHVSKNIKSPSDMIYLKPEFSSERNKSQYVKNKLEYTILKDVIIKNQIYYDPKNTIYQTDIPEDKELLSIYNEFLLLENGEDHEYKQTAPWVIRFIFNKELMMENGIVMEDIHLALLNYDNNLINFIYSDDNSKELIGRISINSNILGLKDDMVNGLYDQTDVLSIFKNIQEDILNNVIIKGVKGITNIVLSEVDNYKHEDNEIKQEKQWILETDGTNILDIFNSEYVDFKNTISNDIISIYNVLGIEAVRELLIEQIRDVVEYEGSYINSRHIEILCDIMTNKGFLTAINRQGINRGDIGPLAKCSFEDTTDQLFKAGIFGEKDKLEGVSSNIMMGQLIHSGTGMSSILLDETKLYQEMENIQFTKEDVVHVQENNIDVLLHEEVNQNEYCNDNDFDFSIDS